MNIIEFENTIKDLLQHNIEMVSTSNLKTIRKGKLILYNMKDFYMTFVIKTIKGDTKYYHFPIPYAFEKKPKLNRVVFKYDNSLIHNNKELLVDLVTSLGESKNIFYDNIVNIEYGA